MRMCRYSIRVQCPRVEWISPYESFPMIQAHTHGSDIFHDNSDSMTQRGKLTSVFSGRLACKARKTALLLHIARLLHNFFWIPQVWMWAHILKQKKLIKVTILKWDSRQFEINIQYGNIRKRSTGSFFL